MHKPSSRIQPSHPLDMLWRVIDREPHAPRLHMIVLGVAIGMLLLVLLPIGLSIVMQLMIIKLILA